MREWLVALFKKFKNSESGNVALTTALLFPVLLGSAGLAIDYVLIYQQTSKLQQAADSAVLAGTKELGIAGNDDEEIMAITKTYALTNFNRLHSSTVSDNELNVVPVISENRRGMNISLEYQWKPFIAHYLSDEVLPLKVTAGAELAGSQSICTLALDPNNSGSIALTGKSSVQAENCSIQTNSGSGSALALSSNAKMNSSSICTSGGFVGSSSNFSPVPQTDCPEMDDPLAGRQLEITDDNCDFENTVLEGGNRTLKPGVYCGGVFVTDEAKLRMDQGTYTFIDGDFDVGGGSEVIGNHVNLNFHSNARLFFRNATEIELSAPKTGDMAGILVLASVNNDPGLVFEIQSKDAREFTGLIYTPNNTIKLGDDEDGDGKCDPGNDAPRIPVSGQSSGLAGPHTHVHTHKTWQRTALGSTTYDENTHSHSHSHDDGNYNYSQARHGEFDTHKHQRQYPHDHLDSPSISEADNTVGCEANVGQYSDWTAIVAKNIIVTSGVDLILNADYGTSSVPLPENNGAIGPQVRLEY